MRLICVPLWLSQTLTYHGLPESALLNEAALSPTCLKRTWIATMI